MSPADENEAAGRDTAELTAEDFYLEGPYIVLTEVYHRKRGYCCNSGCRHCPYQKP